MYMPSGRRVAASGNTGVMTATRRFAAILATDARGSAIKPWDHWPGKSGTAARHPSEASELTLGKDRNGGMKTRSRGQGRTAGVGFESGPWLSIIDEGGF